MESLFIVFALLAVVLIFYFRDKKSKLENKLTNEQQIQLNRQALDGLDVYLQRNRLPIFQGQIPVLLKKDEYPIVCSEAKLAEERSTSHYNGISFRVVKGMYYHTGQSNSETQVTIIDSGLLVVTTKRLVFIGNKRTSITELSKIVGLELFTDAFTLNKENKNKTETYFVEAPNVYKLIIELLNQYHYSKEDETTLVMSKS